MRVKNENLALFLALLLALIKETNAQAELSNPTSYDISQFWPGGFSAKITIGIKREIRFGWLLKLTFTSPVTSIEIFDAQVVEISADGQVYLLKHQNYNARLQTHQGQVSMFFTATQPDGASGPPNSDLLLIELINTFESIEEALKRVGTTLERDGTGNTLDTTPSSRINPVFNGAQVVVNTPPPPTAYSLTTTTTPPYVHDVGHAIHLSLLFFEAQRSGELSMHPKRVDWRQDAGLTDGGYHKVDLVGGYFVDHDFVKFGFPMASSMTLLAWSVIEFKDAYVQSNEYRVAMDALKWGADYFIKCHTNPFEFYGQVGQTKDTNEYWGRPEDMLEAFDEISFKCTNKRPCSDLIAETAAALAATSMVFRGFDEKFQRKCMEKAMQLYKFANQYQELS